MPPLTIPEAFDAALRHHRAGRLAEAEGLYRQILGVQPNHAEALHFLGVIAHQFGRHALAADLIRQSLAGKPNHAAAHHNLGEAYRAQGRPDEAAASYRRALEIEPGRAEVHDNLGKALHEHGLADEAIDAYRRAIELKPDYAPAHCHLGNVLAEQGRQEEAVTAYRQALALNPDFAEAGNRLGMVLSAQGQFAEAATVCRRALELQPGYLDAYNNLGNALAQQGQFDEAIALYQRALQLRPDYLEARLNLGLILNRQGRIEEAIEAYQQVLKLRPDDGYACNNLGNALKGQGRLGEAIAAYRRAVQFEPELASVHSNLIYSLHFHPEENAQTIAEEQFHWNRQFSDPFRAGVAPYANRRDPERRLRIGYVSPDFRDHVVGRNMLPLFAQHDRERFEVLCYSAASHTDAMTERFRALAAGWRNITGLSDGRLADLVREDEVDILVDLAQHIAGGRLPAFARRPAPVQVSFAGYPESAGVEAIKYRITDRYLETKIGDRRSEIGVDLPSPNFDLRPAERVFLLDSFWCYDPCGAAVEVNELPALRSGRITFGNLNTCCKVNEPMLRIWARVLGQVQDSRLVLRSPAGGHRQQTLDILEDAGVAAERIEFVESRGRLAYLELYHRLDMILDTFPYNGHSTSLDALWMGVPVISLAGNRAVSRAGFSQMSNLGLPEWVAFSAGEFCRLATQFARDLPRLAALRATLRARLEASPIMNAPRFARSIETAYRGMWRQWCAQTAPFPC